jgi:hypothetical protein
VIRFIRACADLQDLVKRPRPHRCPTDLDLGVSHRFRGIERTENVARSHPDVTTEESAFEMQDIDRRKALSQPAKRSRLELIWRAPQIVADRTQSSRNVTSLP